MRPNAPVQRPPADHLELAHHDLRTAATGCYVADRALFLLRHGDNEARGVPAVFICNCIGDAEIKEDGTRNDLPTHLARYGAKCSAAICSLAVEFQGIIGLPHGYRGGNRSFPSAALVLKLTLPIRPVTESQCNRGHCVFCQGGAASEEK